MHLESLDDLYEFVERQLAAVGRCEYYSSEEEYVQFSCYDALVFRIQMPQPPYSSLSIKHLIGAGQSGTQRLLGENLTFIENSEAALIEAITFVNHFCRLRLPDKYLRAWDTVVSVH